MNLPFETETVVTEADVELKVIWPLLTDNNFLTIPSESIEGKHYLAPTILDKSAGRTGGWGRAHSHRKARCSGRGQ